MDDGSILDLRTKRPTHKTTNNDAGRFKLRGPHQEIRRRDRQDRLDWRDWRRPHRHNHYHDCHTCFRASRSQLRAPSLTKTVPYHHWLGA